MTERRDVAPRTRTEVHDILANDEYAVALVGAWAQKGDAVVDLPSERSATRTGGRLSMHR
jgi:hypothetical protein